MKSVLLMLIAVFALPVLAADSPRVFIAASATVDASNSRDEAQQVDFGTALAAAIVKKGVPVTIVTDVAKSQWSIKSTFTAVAGADCLPDHQGGSMGKRIQM